METIFSGHGVMIFKRNGKIFMQFDSGELVSKTLEAEITTEEVVKAQKSEKDAYELLLDLERNNRIY